MSNRRAFGLLTLVKLGKGHICVTANCLQKVLTYQT